MYVSWTPHGQGRPQDAIDYILSPLDSKRIPRAGIRVLRGDPQMVANVAGSLDFKWRYKSGSLGFSPEEKLSDQEIQELLDDFERVAFPGLGAHRNCWTAVEHRRPNGGFDIHLVHAMVDLQSGKSMNIAPPGWAKVWDPFRNSWNFRLGLARPDDPRRQKNVQALQHEAFVSAAELRAGLPGDAPSARERIGKWLEAGVRAGALTDRASVLAALEKAGSITRVGSDYISLRLQHGARPLRLRGALLDDTFDAAQWLDADRERSVRVPGHDLVIGSSGRGGDVDLERARAERRRLVPQLEAAAARNRKRFGSDAELGRTGIESDVDGHGDRAPGEGAGRPRAAARPGISQGSGPRLARGPSEFGHDRADGGTPGRNEGSDLLGPEPSHNRSAEGASAPSQSPTLGRAHADRGDLGRLRADDRGHMGLRAAAGRRDAGRASAARAAPAPGPAKPSHKRKAAAMNVPSVVDQFLSLAQARAASASVPFHHHQEQSMTVPDPSQTITSKPSPAVATPTRPSLKDSLRFDAVPKKAAVAAAAAGVDLDRPRPKAGEIAPAEYEPGWLTRIIQAFRALILRLFGVSTIPSGTMVTEPGEPNLDARDELIAILREELESVKSELAKARTALAAAGISLENADVADVAATRTMEAAARALELDKKRDVERAARAAREGAALPGDEQIFAVRAAGRRLAAAHAGPDNLVEVDQARAALKSAEESAATWDKKAAIVETVRSQPQQAAMLGVQRRGLEMSRVMAVEVANALAADQAQIAIDEQEAAEQAEAGADRAPSALDKSNPALAARYRAEWLASNRHIRQLHSLEHQIELDHPRPSDDALRPLSPAERLAAFAARDEALKLARAKHEEQLAELYERRRALAAALWGDELDDEDADADQAAHHEQERPR